MDAVVWKETRENAQKDVVLRKDAVNDDTFGSSQTQQGKRRHLSGVE